MTLNEKPDSSMKIVKTKSLPPAEGERRAMRGYMGQYERTGAAIYAELERGQLEWIGVAYRSASIVDDLKGANNSVNCSNKLAGVINVIQ